MFLVGMTLSSPELFAAQEKPYAYPFLVQGLYIAGALLVGAVIIALVNRWRKNANDSRYGPSDQMAHFRSLYEKGQITQEEFDSLRRVLGGELRRAARAKPADASRTPPSGPDSPPAAQQPAPPNGTPPPQEPPSDGIRPM